MAADEDEYHKWEAGCEKARAEIALCVTAEILHIVRASEDPAIIRENFKMSLGSKGGQRDLHYVASYSTQRSRVRNRCARGPTAFANSPARFLIRYFVSLRVRSGPQQTKYFPGILALAETSTLVSRADTVVLYRSKVVKLRRSCIAIIVENDLLSQFHRCDDKITAEGDSTSAVHEPDLLY